MKKYILAGLFILIFSFGLFAFNTRSANASNCAPGHLFSSETGKPCPASQDNPSLNKAKRDLTLGSRGDDVKELQQKLKDAGFLPGKIDGIYGPMTKKAVTEYEKENGSVNNNTQTVTTDLPLPSACDGAGRETRACDDAIVEQFVDENRGYGLVSGDVGVSYSDYSGRVIEVSGRGKDSKIKKFANILSITSLANLFLDNNQLSGPIPNLPSSLFALYLYNNQLYGSIPNLTSTSLGSLQIWNNQLTGPIPSLPLSLVQLSLSGNKLSGGYSNISSISGLTSAECYIQNNNLNPTGGPSNCYWQPQNNPPASAPTGSFSINNGATTTNTTAVTLNMNVTGATEARFKNAGGTFSGWQPYAPAYPFTLSTTDGTKTVNSEFKNSQGTLVVSDSISLVTTTLPLPTQISLAISPSTTLLVGTTLTLTATTNTHVPDGYHVEFFRGQQNLGGCMVQISEFSCSGSNPTSNVQLTESYSAGIFSNTSFTVPLLSSNVVTVNWTTTPPSTSAPTITSLSPATGPVGTSVTITGSNFTSSNNNVYFGDGHLISGLSSSNSGTKITFSVPTGLSNCTPGTLCTQITPGNYGVYVNNSYGTSEPVTFNVTVINPTQYTLAVSRNGTGVGTVTSNSGGINCGSTCSWTYNSGATITLMATPTTGSTFTNWSGACSGTSSTCTVTMNSAKNVTAVFTANATAAAPTGSFSINNDVPTTNTTAVTLNMSVSNATQMRFKNAGGTFSAWQSYALTYPFTVSSGDGVKTINGEFSNSAGTLAASDSITLTTTNTSAPTITSLSPTFGLAGTSVTITGTNFSSTGNAVKFGEAWFTSYISNGTQITFLVPTSSVPGIYQVFVRNNTLLTSNGQAYFTVTPASQYTTSLSASALSVPVGTNVTLNPTCSAFSDPYKSVLYKDGVQWTDFSTTCKGSGEGVIFTTPQNHTYVAKIVNINNLSDVKAFSAPVTVYWTATPTYTLTVSKSGTGSGTITSSPSGINCGSTSCSASFNANSFVTISAMPAAGSDFSGWSGNGACTGINNDCTINMGSANKSATAIFTPPVTPPTPPPVTCLGGPTGCVRITSLSPEAGKAGARVTVSGAGFTQTGNTVNLGTKVVTKVTGLNSTDGKTLTFTVPNIPTGPYDLTVTNSLGTSLPKTFTVTASSGASVLGAESFHFSRFLKLGVGGDEVVELQKFLNNAGYDVGNADGRFGPKTEVALVKFQTANGLAGDGKVGPLVRALLNK